MPTPTVRSTIALVVAAALTCAAQQPTPGTWPPPVQKVSADSPVRSPADALKTFFLPPGYRLELVASEPLVEEPVAMDIDPDGRLWIVEMRGYMPDAAATGERETVGRVVVLEDTDDDGRMDKRTVFLDGLVLPRAIKVLDRGVLVAEPPNVWLARDTNGDLKSDTKEVVRNDYGRAQGNPEHNANGLMWGLDNWIHTSEHNGYLRLHRGTWEARETLPRGQWGVTMDDMGRVYRNWNENPLFVDLLSPHYFVRNPNLVTTRGAYETTIEDLSVWPVRPTPGVNRGYRAGTLRPDGTLAIFNSAGTPVIYRGDRLPAELRGNAFVTEPAGNLVRRLVISEDAQGRITSKNAYERAEFLTSTDERFRPVNLFSAADGTLYVVDMYRGIIQHLSYQSEYLKNHIRTYNLAQGIHFGRIYRVVHESMPRDQKPSLSTLTPALLVERLSHPNGWYRDTAQRLLVERGDRSVVPALTTLVTGGSGTEVRTKLHALWTLDGLDALEPAIVERALSDASPHVRAAAVRLSERWLREAGHPLQAAIVARLDDPSPVVVRQAAASLGDLPEGMRELSLGSVLERVGADPIAIDAAISGARGRELVLLDRLLRASTPSSPRAEAVAALAGAIVKGKQAAAMQSVFTWAAEPGRVAWQRLALLRGAESGLPGTNSFAALMAMADAGGPGAAGAPRLSLDAHPAALVTLATEKSELGQRAARLLDALDWPGKPKAASRTAAPLTAVQQKHFAAGEEVYRNLCTACHQAQGTGLAGLAPPLVGSKWALGRAGLLARIILNGKESTTLMPPLGATLTDQQIADVLTYVRRSWGHTASFVDVNLVREVRGASTGRDRPWTEAELAKVTQPDGVPRRQGQ
jgi:mono/diheme cytochrome c family protein/glucose/arabinose dehydrogenase